MPATPAQNQRPARLSTPPARRRPVYQVTLQRDRPVRHHKRQISELPKPLRILANLVIGSCLGWLLLVGSCLIAFLILFSRVASLILPQILAHFP